MKASRKYCKTIIEAKIYNLTEHAKSKKHLENRKQFSSVRTLDNFVDNLSKKNLGMSLNAALSEEVLFSFRIIASK